MEYRHLKNSLFISLFLTFTGCSTMSTASNNDEAIINLFTMPSIDYRSTNDFLGYNSQQSYYSFLANRDTEEYSNFTGIGKFISNDPKLKLQIQSIERDIKSNNVKSSPPTEFSLYLTKGDKKYRLPFGSSEKQIELQSKVFQKINSIQTQIYTSHSSCEYCFEPSIDLTRKGQDYIFNLKLKNIGTNDFDLEGISALKKVEISKSDSMLALKIDENLIQFDKTNLLDNKYLDKIQILKNSEVTIPFIIRPDEIPEKLKGKDLTQLRTSAYLLSQYASGELKGAYFDIAVSRK